MRDIRKDIDERIDALDARRESLQIQIKRIDEKIEILQQLLEQENVEWEAKQPSLLSLGKDIAPIKAY